MKRGTIKAFREHLNAKFSDSENHRHGPYHQLTRGYGDYLYAQDRHKFNVELADAIKAGWTMNVYQKNGFQDRKAYLTSLCDEYPSSYVCSLADLLGPNEDFDGLVTMLEDYAQEATS